MLHCQVVLLCLLLICPFPILVSAFDRIEKFYPTTFDRDALESGGGQQSTSTEATTSTTQGTTNGHSFAGRKIKLTAPDENSNPSSRILPRRQMKSKGVVLDDAGQELTQQATATSDPPVVTSSIPPPSESKAEDIPQSPQPFIPSAASAKQYFYNIDRHLSRIRDLVDTSEDDDKTSSSSQPSPSTTIPSGPWSQHHDPQMVLVFAHSVEIPLVVTPPRNMMSSSSANPSVRMVSSSSQPRFVHIRGHLKAPFPQSNLQQPLISSIVNPSNPLPAPSFRRTLYTPLTSASHPQGLRHFSPEDWPYHHHHPDDSTPSSSNRRPFTVLPMTRYTYYDHEASASDTQESRQPHQRMVTLFHPVGWAPTTLLRYQWWCEDSTNILSLFSVSLIFLFLLNSVDVLILN